MSNVVTGRGTASIADASGALAEGVEVVVEAVANGMVLLRRKGKSQVEMLPEALVTNFVLAETSTSSNGSGPLKQRSLLPVEEAKARRHLLDGHGINLTWVNQNTAAAALEYHNSIDHADLGHNHDKVETAETAAETTEVAPEQ